MLAGDVTIEVNPAFSDSSMKKLIKTAAEFRVMAEQGFIEMVGDSHRNKKGFTEIAELIGLKLLHPLQLTDAARGREECVAFFRTFEDYYREMMSEAVAAHERLGEATAREILAELGKSENKNVKFKLMMPFPSRPELVPYCALKEYGFSRRRRDGDRILFTPPEKWSL